MLRKIFLISTVAIAVLCVPASVSASENASTEEATEEDDDWVDEEITQTFYVPKARFQSTYDYREYCQRMYNNGYMDEYYNWTDEALEYINNPTKEKSEALDKAARELVEKRVEEGKIAPEDNPFLTYEEKQALLTATPAVTAEPTTAEPTTTETEVTPTEEATPTPTEAATPTPMEEATVTPTEETIAEENTSFGKFIAAAIITLAAMLAYYIFRKRNK